MTLDLTRPVQTRDGRPVELITTVGRGDYPIVGYVAMDPYPIVWRISGEPIGRSPDLELINVPVKREGWLNIYPSPVGCKAKTHILHRTRDEANVGATSDRVACIRVEWTEGDGL